MFALVSFTSFLYLSPIAATILDVPCSSCPLAARPECEPQLKQGSKPLNFFFLRVLHSIVMLGRSFGVGSTIESGFVGEFFLYKPTHALLSGLFQGPWRRLPLNFLQGR